MFVQSLVASSRSVQTATQADAIDATCGPGAEDAGAGGARDLSRVTTAPSARGAGGGSDARGAGAAGCTRRSPLPLAENLVALLVSGAITGVTATVHTDDEIVFAASRGGACCFAGAALLVRSLWSRILGASGSTITLGAGARPDRRGGAVGTGGSTGGATGSAASTDASGASPGKLPVGAFLYFISAAS